MLRKLVALLVLVTGLAALGQPAQALNVDVESVSSAFDTSYACVGQIGQMADQRASRSQREATQPKPCPKPPRVVLDVPTVMLHADRARE